MRFFIFCLLFIRLNFQSVVADKFQIAIDSPSLIKNYFKEGIKAKEMFEGLNKSFYKEKFRLQTLPTGTDGCRKFTDFSIDGEEKTAILLEESDLCPITTRTSNAYDAGVSMIIIKHQSNNLDELAFGEDIIRGLNLPLIYIKKDDAQFLMDWLLQSDPDKIEKVYLNVTHQNQIDVVDKSLVIVMHSYAKENQIISFLTEFLSYSHAFKDYKINLYFTLRMDQASKSENFLRPQTGCLSGGRYCSYHNNQSTLMTYHTLRMICIRDIYGLNVLIQVLDMINKKIKNEKLNSNGVDKLHEQFGEQTIKEIHLDSTRIKNCMDSSFFSANPKEKADATLDDNSLLSKEFQTVHELPVHSSIPMIYINGVVYEGLVKSFLFIQFCCENGLINCKSNKQQKKIILVSMMLVSLLFIFSSMLFCKKRL